MNEKDIDEMLNEIASKAFNDVENRLRKKGQKKKPEILCCMMAIFESCITVAIHGLSRDSNKPYEIVLAQAVEGIQEKLRAVQNATKGK